MRKTMIGVVVLACLVCGVFIFVQGGFGFMIAKDLAKSTKAVTDVSEYGRIRNQVWRWQSLVQHFPLNVSTQAVESAFYYKSLVPRSGGAIQLKLVLSDSEIAALDGQFRKGARAIYNGGTAEEHQKQSEGLPTTSYFTSGSEDLRFPDDFAVIVTGTKGQRDGSPFKHGESYGVAISTERSTIVYWAEAW